MESIAQPGDIWHSSKRGYHVLVIERDRSDTNWWVTLTLETGDYDIYHHTDFRDYFNKVA